LTFLNENLQLIKLAFDRLDKATCLNMMNQNCRSVCLFKR